MPIVGVGDNCDDRTVWETTDPDGRRVVLTDERWEHVIVGHPYVRITPEELIGVVAEPSARMSGPESGEEWFYGTGLGPSRWIRVVVHYEHDEGLIRTAFPRRAYP